MKTANYPLNSPKMTMIKINGEAIRAEEGQTILEAAQENGISIPSLCYHSDLDAKSSCRLCIVKIKGEKELKTACSTKVREGMKITTDSHKIKKLRKINLELIFSQHIEECNDCILKSNCHLLDLAKEYGVEITRFPDRKAKRPLWQFGPSFIFDSTKCIDCRNCVEMCERQGINFWEIKGKGHEIKIVPSKKEAKDCIGCGQCILHCPAGALEAVGEFEDIEKPLEEKDKIIVFQFAPAIRTSIGEEFGLPPGKVVTEKLAAAIRKLGAHKVFDVSLGADFTTTEEAKELTNRLEKNQRLPMFTSCCPSWVKLVEFYYPEFISHLTTVRSPHIILGGLIKTFWAEKNKIDPKKITVVSIMPCISKKYEITRKELEIAPGIKPVDYVLTTRELAYLLIKCKINLKSIKPQKLDNPLGLASGAGVIYGASGGVMESALRTICDNLTGKKLPKLKFENAKGIKKAEIKIGDRKMKVAIVNGSGNAFKLLEELKENPNAYDYVEVMACPGGCIGGGGQPVPTDEKIRQKRASGLRKIDAKKKVKKEPRLAHKNPIVEKVYRDYLKRAEKTNRICHTKFSKKSKGKPKKYYL